VGLNVIQQKLNHMEIDIRLYGIHLHIIQKKFNHMEIDIRLYIDTLYIDIHLYMYMGWGGYDE